MTTPTPPGGASAGQAPTGGASAGQAPSSSRSVPGAVVGGRYTLRDPIGSGGMGAVWRAHDDLLRRDVAVKEVLLPPGIPADEQTAMYERTLREARAAAGLSHPSVVRVYDVITDNHRPWIVMELLQARSVADMISQDGTLPPRAIAKIGLSVLGALEAAHSAGVLHRDVKPANVLICSDGRCVLTDFGVARIMTDNAALTSPGMVLGSPQYISPERAMGAAFGPPSDLFSLGVTLYTAAEGKPPFDRGDPLATMHAVVYEDPEPPRRAGPLTPVLLGLLAKEPKQRWDVSRTRAQLRAVLSGPLTSPAGNGPSGFPASAGGPSGGNPMSGGSPMSGPPMSGPPTSGPPTSGPPMSGPPMSGPPMSGPPMSGPPMSGPPMSGQPMPGQPMSAPPVSGPPVSGQPMGAGGAYQPGRSSVQVSSTPSQPAEPHYGSDYGPPPDHTLGYGSTDRPSRRHRFGPWLVAAGAAAVAILLVVVAIGAGSGWFSDSPADTRTTPTGAENPGDVKSFHDTRNGFAASVPKDWARDTNSADRQYDDPADRTAWIRFSHRKLNSSAAGFLRGAGHGLRGNRSYRDYQQIALRTNVSMAGQHAAELEYRLTDAKSGQVRHAIWRVVVVDSKSYEIYMSVPDKLFGKEKPVFEQSVKSYKLG